MNLPDFTELPGAVAIDLDGTLLSSEKTVTDRAARSLDACIKAGIAVIIATSRPARWMPRIFTGFQMSTFSFINQNGAVTRGNGPLSGLRKEVLPTSLVTQIMEAILAIEPDMRLTLELEGWEFGTNQPRDEVELWAINAAIPDMQLSIEQALEQDVTKIAAGGLDRGIMHVAEDLDRRFGKDISIVPGDGLTFLNITGIRATKPGAIARLLAPAGMSPGDVLAFGDDIPDLDMLKACGMAVAMANACREVLDSTPYHTASNDEDGVAVVLDQLLTLR